jgi:hypothetical protein
MVRPWFWALAIGALFAFPLVRTFLRPAPRLPPVRAQVPRFTLVREGGAEFGSNELQGKVWVAARFAVDAQRPQMRAELELERRMRKLADAFELTSFAPDASPPELADWSRTHQIYARRWALVTGTPEKLAPVLAALELDAPGGASDSTLVLVDTHGRVRGRYDASPTDKDSLEQLVFDAALLVNNY